jgi:hypothetical protein
VTELLQDIFEDVTERNVECNSAGQEVIYGINRDPYVVAEKEGLEVVLPDEYTLQLDIDTEAAYTTFIMNLRRMEKDTDFYFKPFEMHWSKSGRPKCHVTLKSRTPMTIWQRIALQMVFGSDMERERLNIERVLLNDPYPIAFFEKKL